MRSTGEGLPVVLVEGTSDDVPVHIVDSNIIDKKVLDMVDIAVVCVCVGYHTIVWCVSAWSQIWHWYCKTI